MKRTRTKTLIRVERRERITVRAVRLEVLWCWRCAMKVSVLTADEAAALLKTTTRDIFLRVESGEVHFRETESGSILVCSNSLELSRNRSGD
jgi:hypothetical protein